MPFENVDINRAISMLCAAGPVPSCVHHTRTVAQLTGCDPFTSFYLQIGSLKQSCKYENRNETYLLLGLNFYVLSC
jgi:hypothetical protein